MRACSLVFAVALLWLPGCALDVPRGELPLEAASNAQAHTAEKPAGGSAVPRADVDPATLAKAIANLQSLGPLDPVVTSQLADDMAHSEPHLWPLVLEQLRSKIAYQRKVRATSAATEKPAAEKSSCEKPAAEKPAAEKPAGEKSISEKAECNQPLPAPAQQSLKTSNQPSPVHVCHDGCCAPQAAESNTPKTAHAGRQSGDGEKKPSPPTVREAPRPAAPPPALLSVAACPPKPTLERIERKDMPLKLAAARAPVAALGFGTAGQAPRQARDQGTTSGTHGQSFSGQGTQDQRTDGQGAQTAAQNGTTCPQSERADLEMRNLTFCSEVSSYGVYTPLDARKLRPGQEALVYVEIENFRSDVAVAGYHTALRCRYRILDASTVCHVERELPMAEDYCRNRRRDFFLRYFVWLPASLPPGSYKIELSVDDALGAGRAKSTADFAISAN